MGNSHIKAQRLLIGLAATGSLLMAGSTPALEFGSISLASHLNQPLTAQIRLSSLSDAERASLNVRIASPDMFERFGIARSSDVDNLDVSTRAGSSGQMIVEISTRNAVREPFVDFLLEASTSNGSALRQYTVLLNPASTSVAGRPRTQQPSALRRAQTPAVPSNARVSSAPRPSSQTTAPDQSGQSAQSGRYGPVTDGETLYSIALAQRPPGTTVAQMELALFKANPRSFAGGMNNLLRGTMLDLPSADTVRQTSQSSARQRLAQATAVAAAAASQGANSTAADASDERGAVSTGPGVTRATGEAPPADVGVAESPTVSAAAGDGVARRSGAKTGTPEFGQLSMPRPGTWADTTAGAASGTQPGSVGTTGQTTSPAADSAGLDAGVVSRPGPAAQSGLDIDSIAGQPGATSGPDALVATPPTSDSMTTQANAFDDADSADIQDVTAGGSDSLLSPRNLLLGLLLVGVIGGGLLVRRRRQYKPMPLNFDETDEDESQATPAVPSAPVADSQATRLEPVFEERSPHELHVPPPVASSREHALSEAAACVSVGEYASARRCIEDGLVDHPHDASLQDKLLDMDYQFGDAVRFQQDYTRFEPDIGADRVRHERIMEKGRALLPDDPRFGAVAAGVAGGAALATGASAADDDAFVPASLRRQHESSSASSDDESLGFQQQASAGDDSLDYSAEPAASTTDDELSIDDYDFEESDTITPRMRQHDQGSDDGLSFELDDASVKDPDELTQANGPRYADADAGNPAAETSDLSLDMINSADFNLDDSASDVNANDLDSDTVEIRLDLARMYMEMEDNAMARPLLEEVKANGDDAQKRTAQSLLDLIG